MKLLFNLEYQTTFGEELVLNVQSREDASKVSKCKMTTLDGLHWFCELTKTVKAETYIDYYYSLIRGDEEARQYVVQTVAHEHRFEERGARLDAYRCQEQHQSYLAQHHIGRRRGVGHQMYLIAVAAYEDGDDQRSAGQT